MTYFFQKVLPAALFLLLFSYLFLSEGIPLFIKSLQARNWSSVSGKIVGTDFIEKKRHIKFSTTILWDPYPSYSYSVNGKEYVGHRIHLNFKQDRIHFESDLEEMKTSYPVGKTVEVHYNPKNPADSVLFNTFNYYSGLNSFAALLGILIPLAIMGFTLRDKSA